MEVLLPKEASLFGQGFVAIIMHEIFHNIANVIREASLTSQIQLKLAIDGASKTKNAKVRRMIFEKYVNSIDPKSDVISKIKKKQMVKTLCMLVSLQDNRKKLKELETKSKTMQKDPNKANDMVDLIVSAYKSELERMKKESPEMKKYKVTKALFDASSLMLSVALVACVMMIFNAGSIPLAILGKINKFTILGGLVFSVLGLFSNISYQNELKRVINIRNEYRSAKLYEEYYCDLFAGMYQLPVVFFIGYTNKHVPNDVDKKRLEELARIEKMYTDAIMDTHPSSTSRNITGLKIAKKLLESNDIKLDPEVKSYCKFIVDNFSKLDDPDIMKYYNSNLLDPKEADDLDKHLEMLINDNDITVTESFIQWMKKDTVYSV
jgi:hypothetical protein